MRPANMGRLYYEALTRVVTGTFNAKEDEEADRGNTWGS